MRIAITGSNGQLGRALQRTLANDALMPIDLPDYDISDLTAITAAVRTFAPDVILHTAAITDVDGCERNPDLAYRVNVLGTRNMAVCAQQTGASIVYIGTDYVYEGTRETPYREEDAPNPLSVYAQTKWLGEEQVRRLVSRHYVVRVAWLYGDGPRNFVRTVLRLADERDSLPMVTDEVGSPTFADDVAAALQRLIALPAYGTYQLPNSGVCSRYDWAAEILRLAGRTGDLELVPSQNYQRLARVPRHVEMRNFNGADIGIVMRPWQEALRDYMGQQGLLANA
jgi:dTDP-4-dehydrorhamnose reductase